MEKKKLGGGVKNWPNLPTDSSKKLPTGGGRGKNLSTSKMDGPFCSHKSKQLSLQLFYSNVLPITMVKVIHTITDRVHRIFFKVLIRGSSTTLKSLISVEFYLFFLRKFSQLHALLEPPRPFDKK